MEPRGAAWALRRDRGGSGSIAPGWSRHYHLPVVSGLGALGRALLVLGAVLALLGLLFLAADRFPGLRIGRLPGDVRVHRDGFSFYFPVATSILLSLVLSLLLWLFGRR